MTGGLIQIIGHGTQDTYLVGDPTITFFESVYKRHTNFASEFIELPFNGVLNFGNKVNVKISRNADLISKMCIIVRLNKVINNGNNFAWVKRLGHAILKEVTISIGGTIIDTQFGLWLDIWYELAKKKNHAEGYNIMIGNVEEMIKYNKKDKPEYNLYIPLQFWFNRFYNLAVPIICLNNNYDINVSFSIEDLEKLIIVSNNFDYNTFCKENLIKDITLLVNYIYLDNIERKKFMDSSHEYLIDQVQQVGPYKIKNENCKYKMNFNKLVKEIFWVTRKYMKGDEYLYYDPNITSKTINKVLTNASKKIVSECISYIEINDCWVKVFPYSKVCVDNLFICNKRKEPIYVNSNSLIYDGVNLINKISATITIDDKIIVDIIDTKITIFDLSIPVSKYVDTRCLKHDPKIYDQFNYGLLIDGSINPTSYGKIIFDNIDRVDKREGEYFNYIEPEKRHSCLPKDGLNVYSFSLYPEEFQPSGAANIRFDTYLDLYSKELNGELTILCSNYNVLRISGGILDMAF